MKRIFFILLTLTCMITSVFGSKNRLYENRKVIDAIYVNSEEELKIRYNPSLKSNGIYVLTHRFL